MCEIPDLSRRPLLTCWVYFFLRNLIGVDLLAVEKLFFKFPSNMAQPLSRLGLRLIEEEHEQQDSELHQLFVAQLQLDCQLNHSKSL